MTTAQFASLFASRLPYAPNEQQQALIGTLSRFCSAQQPPLSVFIVNGYAGTGKTSLTGALVKALTEVGRPVVLLAPTGRAAKVFSAAAAHPAFTIHRKIYRGASADPAGGSTFLQHNNLDGAVFIVDEASMISDSQAETDSARVGSGLLEDLVEYVFTADNTRLILLGDVAQLPPVGSTESPAMQPARFKQLGLHVSRATLTDTRRQTARSGILANATWLRRAMLVDPLPQARISIGSQGDVAVVEPSDVADKIGDLYRNDGPDETILITRSNRRATQFNLGIRSVILDREEELAVGERLLVAKNNYAWSARIKGLDFIANGDVGIVTDIRGFEERYGFRFADITLRLIDRDIEVECKIILDTLVDDNASLTADAMRRLAELRMADPEAFAPSLTFDQRLRRLRTDPYFSALQVKYAYAVTCHKAQGAQWRNVFIDLGGIPPENQGLDFYRWLYTAITRSTSRLFLLNPDEALITP